ncbi:MAG: radical SAM protein [Acidobacteriia bacterium]|nr:radical SAM protein [Terriglobia bacterium]
MPALRELHGILPGGGVFEESGGGVTLSGGEPVSQPRFASALLRACRKRGIRTALETCGFAHPDTFLDVALAADLVLFDLKVIDPALHRRYTGVSNARILANLEALTARNRAVTVRIPVVPGVNDSEEEAGRFARVLAGIGRVAVELLPYHRIGAEKYRRLGLAYGWNGTPEPAAADLERFAARLSQNGLGVKIRG